MEIFLNNPTGKVSHPLRMGGLEMKNQKTDYSAFKPLHLKSREIEEHCRKVHAEAVVHGFVLLVSVPKKLVGKLLKTDRRKHSNFTPSKSQEGFSLS